LGSDGRETIYTLDVSQEYPSSFLRDPHWRNHRKLQVQRSSVGVNAHSNPG